MSGDVRGDRGVLTRIGVGAVILIAGILLAFVPFQKALAHGGSFDVVVETKSDAGGVEYGVGLVWSDGDPMTAAQVVIRAERDLNVEIAEAREVSPAMYVGSLGLEAVGDWVLTVEIEHPEGSGTVEFSQTVTDPTPVSWMVVVDTANPERVGSPPDPSEAILALPVPVSTTTSVVPSGTSTPATQGPVSTRSHETPAGGVVVDLPTVSPAREIGFRLAHLLGIGLWMGPVVGAVFGRWSRKSVAVALVGMPLTLATGVVLVLWSAPIGFPGIFDWGRLGGVSYGSAYLGAFALKMVGVLTAAGATIRWAIRADRRVAATALVAGGLALVAVTAMSQFHLLSHG